MSRYHLLSRGRESGPHDAEKLREMVRLGVVSRMDRLSTDGKSWRPIVEFDDVFAATSMSTPTPHPTPTSHMPATPPHATSSPPSTTTHRTATPTGPVRRRMVGDVITVGRDKDCDIVVDTLAVARRHLALVTDAAGVRATDLGSGAETFVNGYRLNDSHLLSMGDTVSVGGVQFKFDGSTLVQRQANAGLAIRVRGLGREVIDHGTRKPKMLIRDVSLSLLPAEFIALVGSAGAGKSTLFLALSGRVRGTHGQVLYDGQDLYSNFEAFRANIGYVPQKDVFHDVLPVGDALRAVSRLRLSRDTSRTEIEANIDRVLEIVSLTAKKNSIISTLSGGEQKRISIAMELHNRPRILFLDEPTAPLDPKTTAEMMDLFRGLADSGITVVMITHAANTLLKCDVIAYMHKGVLTFQGSPPQMLTFFGVHDIEQAYFTEGQRTPEQWRDRFNQTAENQQFFSTRWAKVTGKADAGSIAEARAARRKSAGLAAMWFQTRVLTARYLRVVTIDRPNLVLTLTLAPLVAGLLCLITWYMKAETSPVGSQWEPFIKKQNIICFGSVMSVIFLALFGSVREIVKELPIYMREHFVNVEIVPYLLSKLIVLLLIDAIQVGAVIAIVNTCGHMQAGSIGLQFAILYLCAAVGTALGLAISAIAQQTDHAVTGMIVVVIPQILFSSVFDPLKGLPRVIAGALVTTYWGLNSLMHEATLNAPANPAMSPYVRPADAIVVLIGQWLVLVGVAYWLMERKDGPGAEERIVQKLMNAIGLSRQ